MPKRLTVDDLQKFCSDDDPRVDIQAPFSQGERTHATNGHIAISVPRIKKVKEQGTPDMGKVYNMVDFDDPARVWVLPPEPVFTIDRCHECDAQGYIRPCSCESGCRKCDGLGWIPAKQGEPEAEPCSRCIEGEIISGSVLVAGPKGETALASKYVELIRTLPSAEIGLIGNESDGLKAPVCIRFDGGIGLLMPVSASQEIGETNENPRPLRMLRRLGKRNRR